MTQDPIVRLPIDPSSHYFFIYNAFILLFCLLKAYSDYCMRRHCYVVTKPYYRIESNHTSDSGSMFWILHVLFLFSPSSKKQRKELSKSKWKNPEQEAHRHNLFLELSKIMYILSQKKQHFFILTHKPDLLKITFHYEPCDQTNRSRKKKE